MKKLSILGICGSTKSNSSTLSILEFIAKNYTDHFELNIYTEIGNLPHFNPEHEEQLPESILELRQLINKADGIIFCTPEYVYSLPGSLKNMIEWNVSTVLFFKKPVAMIIAAASGEKAYESLALILKTIECSLPEESKLLIKGAKGKLNEDGEIIDQETIEKLEKLLKSLTQNIQK